MHAAEHRDHGAGDQEQLADVTECHGCHSKVESAERIHFKQVREAGKGSRRRRAAAPARTARAGGHQRDDG